MRELNSRELDAVAGGWFLSCFSWLWSCKPKTTCNPCDPCPPKKDDCKPASPPPN